jgi:membrane-associated phospholipid phosphatase
MNYILTNISNLNLLCFKLLNDLFGKPVYDKIMIFCDKFGGPYIFHYHLTFIFIIASFLLYKKRTNLDAQKELLIVGTSGMLTLFFSIVLCLVTINNLVKGFTAIERPFCAIKDLYNLTEITKKLTCTRSFPSGHVTFSIILVTSFWPLLNRFFKLVGVFFIVIVCISRIASGAHFPIDILGAIILTLPLTIYIQNKSLILSRKIELSWSLFNKFQQIVTKIKLKT